VLHLIQGEHLPGTNHDHAAGRLVAHQVRYDATPCWPEVRGFYPVE
jgi:hypothetical protein